MSRWYYCMVLCRDEKRHLSVLFTYFGLLVGLQIILIPVNCSGNASLKTPLGVVAQKTAGFGNVGIRPKFYTDPTEDAVIMTKYFDK